MAEVVAKVGLKREAGFLYYLGKDGNIWRAGMKRKNETSTEEAKKVADCNVKRETGFLYFIDKNGDVSRAKMAQRKKKA